MTRLVYTKESSENSSISRDPFTVTATNQVGYEEQGLQEYLICPFRINSFNIIVANNKTIDRYVAEGK